MKSIKALFVTSESHTWRSLLSYDRDDSAFWKMATFADELLDVELELARSREEGFAILDEALKVRVSMEKAMEVRPVVRKPGLASDPHIHRHRRPR